MLAKTSRQRKGVQVKKQLDSILTENVQSKQPENTKPKPHFLSTSPQSDALTH